MLSRLEKYKNNQMVTSAECIRDESLLRLESRTSEMGASTFVSDGPKLFCVQFFGFFFSFVKIPTLSSSRSGYLYFNTLQKI